MGRRPAQSDAKLDTPKPKLKKKKKGRRKAIPILEPSEREEPGSSSDVITPRKGMVFKTFEEICEFYNRYAQHLGFATKIKASSHKRAYIQIMCWKGRKRDKRRLDALAPRPTIYTNCPAVVKVGLSQCDGMYHLKEVVLEHNHELNPLRMHFFRDENMLGAGVKKRRKNYGDVNVEEAKDQNVSLQEREWMITSVEEEQCLKLAKEDVEAINWYFGHMQSSSSNFFYLMDIDNECRLKNLFWADGRSRSAYRYFGDVLLLDTSYLASKFNVPLATFVGVNNHGQSVLMGCGLLSDESARTFTWLLRAFLSCMSGHPPRAIITDNCSGIREAVKQVLPGCPHRFCLSQIMRRIPEKLEGCSEYKDIKKSFKKVIYESLRHHEFEMKWQNMIKKYGLIYNDWLRVLYEDRQCWVPAFVKDTFWAGMSITLCGENMDSFFEGHLESNTSVKKFLNQYEMTMETKYESEALADFESFHKVPPLSTQFYMEEQLSEIYTIDIFTKFQDEVKALVYCHPSLIKTDGSVYTFEVTERIRVNESKMMLQKNYEVVFKEHGQDVQCICRSYQFRGILCRHALSVFNFQDIDEVPSQYITERWRKDFKGLQAASYPSYEMVANGPMERYENLYKRCLKLADVGSMSDDNYEFSLKLMNQTMGKLLEENFTNKGKEVKIMFVEPTTNQDDVHDATTNANENDGRKSDEVRHLTEEKRKGKKQQKESVVGTWDDNNNNNNNNKEKEQTNLANSPAIFHTVIPLAFQRTITPSSWNPWNFPPVNQIQPSNLLYYAAAPVNHPQYRLPLQKDQIDHLRVGSNSGDLRMSQQTLEKNKKPEAPPGPKRKKRNSSQIVELSS